MGEEVAQAYKIVKGSIRSDTAFSYALDEYFCTGIHQPYSGNTKGNWELMDIGSLPLWVSLGSQQADFRVAPCPEAKAVKPAIRLLVLFQPDESNAFVGEAPSLDQPERLRELRESGP